MSGDQDVGKYHSIKIVYKTVDNVEEFRCWEQT